MAPAAQQRGGGVIALLAQGDPPHQGPGRCHISPGPSRRIVLKTGNPSTDSRARPEPVRGRGYSSTTHNVAQMPRSASTYILPAESVCGPNESRGRLCTRILIRSAEFKTVAYASQAAPN